MQPLALIISVVLLLFVSIGFFINEKDQPTPIVQTPKEIVPESEEKPPVLPKEISNEVKNSDVEIKNVQIEREDTLWNIHVTLEHPDSGWDHYADMWRVLDGNGNIIATRILMHPHENEQPFTRSLFGINIPKNISKVYIEAQDTVHGLTKRREVNLTK